MLVRDEGVVSAANRVVCQHNGAMCAWHAFNYKTQVWFLCHIWVFYFKKQFKGAAMNFNFFFTNALLGVGLAMDAFSVSLANGLADHSMKKRRMFLIAGVFAFFQALMPFLGWLCVHTLAEVFDVFSKFIPFIALALLTFIGGKMLLEGIKACRAGCCDDESIVAKFSLITLLVQGIATSIDALSVGFTIAHYGVWEALVAALVIAVITFIICTFGVLIGKKFGAGLSGKATILGGSILVVIGIYIFIKGMIA